MTTASSELEDCLVEPELGVPCECGLVVTHPLHGKHCGETPIYIAGVRHTGAASCKSVGTTVMLCQSCLDFVLEWVKEHLVGNSKCGFCGQAFVKISDLIDPVMPL